MTCRVVRETRNRDGDHGEHARRQKGQSTECHSQPDERPDTSLLLDRRELTFARFSLPGGRRLLTAYARFLHILGAGKRYAHRFWRQAKRVVAQLKTNVDR